MKSLLLRNQKLVGWIVIFIVIAVTIAISIIGPQKVVSLFGARHSYFVVFLMALVAGSSTFTSAAFYTTVISFSTAGLDPLLLGIIGGPGLVAGDLLYFSLGEGIQKTLPRKAILWLQHFSQHFERKNLWRWIPLITYFWAGFMPIPVDMWMLFLSTIDYKLRGFIIPLILGEITFVILIADIGDRLFQWLL